ncbi:MAG: WD40 repeat domain-containing protein [Candidatus Coatesbacteria bacterium]|nr:WD40 repeat domain-containing protein [Candidatus Coatesbacteria bacterium]
MKKILLVITSVILISTNFLSSEGYFISTSADHTAKYWKISDGTCILTFANHSNQVACAAISPDGFYALTGGVDSKLFYWDLRTGEIKLNIDHPGGVITDDINPEGTFCLSGGFSLNAYLWSLTDGSLIRVFVGHKDEIETVVFSPDGQYMLSGSWITEKAIKYWRVSDGACIRTFTGNDGAIRKLDFSLDGYHFISGSNDMKLKYWRVDNGMNVTIYRYDNTVGALCFNPKDNNYILAGSYSGEIKYWKWPERSCILTFNHGSSCNSLDFSPDGKYAISGGSDNNIKFWDMSNGTCLRTFSGHTQPVTCVKINPVNFTGFNNYNSSSSLPSHSLSISPNPFSSRLSLSLLSSGSIYSLAGQLIMKLDKGKHSLDTSKWREGVYIVKAGKECKKIVKIK